MILEFFAAGHARPKGSKRMVRTTGGRTLLLEDSKREGPWRQSVTEMGRLAMRGRPRFLDEALKVVMVFGFARPKAHYLKHGLRPDAPRWHIGKPDASKLARSVEDALNGIAWDDDSRIAHLVVVKRYVERDEAIGVALHVHAAPCMCTGPDDAQGFYRRLAAAQTTGAALADLAAHALEAPDAA